MQPRLRECTIHDGCHWGGLGITLEPIRDLVPIHRASKKIASGQAEGQTDTVPAVANGLRKALGHWDTQGRLLGFCDRFLAGCRERGVDPAGAEHIWAMIASFSGYSFAKAHSASYAMVSF